MKEREQNIYGSLTERAKSLVMDKNYLKNLYLLKKKSDSTKFMDFVMDGVKIGLPYNGQKVTQGYLKKETQSVNIFMKKQWQPKYCVIDLTKFLFKYAKNPT